jgi:Caspase domain
MGDIYALMVGINRYLDPGIPDLAGCVNDIRDATAYLEQRRLPDTRLHLTELVDHEATGTAIVDGIRHHLGLAGPDDVALFWFSGHGSTEPVGQFWHLEPNGKELHTLVCADSRVDGRPDLLDKELGVLLDDLAQRGCHVVAVLDSCHSGGATRDQVTTRSVDRTAQPPSYHLLPDLAERYADGPPPVRYVLLAACQPEERAGEEFADGAVRGRFSRALLLAMNGAPTRTTYRELVLLARNQVEQRTATQRPLVFPDGHGLADARLFGGGAISEPPTFTMRYGKQGWQVNAGAAHGMAPGRTRLTVEGSIPAREVDVTDVDVGRSLVAPIGWQPDPAQVYRLLVSRPPHPTLFGIEAERFPGTADSLRADVGDDDPYVRIVDVEDAELILQPQPNGVRLTTGERERIATLAAFPTVADLHHIARWWRVRTLSNGDSRIAHGVLLEIVERLPGEAVVPRQRAASPPDPDGTLRLSYDMLEGEPTSPCCFLRLRNTTNQPLYCVLLDLTERFAVAGDLFRAGRIEAGQTVAVSEGKAIEFFLPDEWADRPGAEYRDWLMLIASTDEIDAAPYEMPNLDQSRDAQARDIRSRTSPTPAQGDWWTSVLPVVTIGPR